MDQFSNRAASVSELCSAAGVGRSSFYYEPSASPRGCRPSGSVLLNGQWVDNQSMLPRIRELLTHEHFSYGYLKVTRQLQKDGYFVNKKKVYRLMKAHSLLKRQAIASSGKREFVRFRKPQATKPLSYFEMDIKYIYIHQEGRNAYLLSVIDVFSRKIVGYIFSRSIRKRDVIGLWQSIRPSIPDFKSITIRNDNGSQFIANDVRGYFRYHEIRHEFTHVATPQDDGHIEAFHSILQREFLSRNEYTGFGEMKDALERYMESYNGQRLHGSLNYKTPNDFIEEHYKYKKNAIEKDLNTNQNMPNMEPQEKEKSNSANLNLFAELCQTLS